MNESFEDNENIEETLNDNFGVVRSGLHSPEEVSEVIDFCRLVLRLLRW